MWVPHMGKLWPKATLWMLWLGSVSPAMIVLVSPSRTSSSRMDVWLRPNMPVKLGGLVDP